MRLNNFFKNSFQNLKQIDFKEIAETIKNFKIEDLKEIKYRRVLYNLRNSKYAKPSLGIISATILFFLLLIPAIQVLNNSFRKVKQYEYEAKNLDSKIIEFQNETKKIKDINLIMDNVDSSFLKSLDGIFVINLLNSVAKKVNVKIDEFKPIVTSDNSNLCKSSKSQRKSQNFKRIKKKKNNKAKGSIVPKYYELNLKSDYLDLVQYFQEIQNYDVNIIIHCLEVISENQKLITTENNTEVKTSIITELDQDGSPINLYENNINGEIIPNFSEVQSRIVIKIPFQVN